MIATESEARTHARIRWSPESQSAVSPQEVRHRFDGPRRKNRQYVRMAAEIRVPQWLTFVTLGTRDMARRRAFYASWGWGEWEGGSDEFAQFDMGAVRFALYPLDLLGDEAAPGAASPPAGWNGVALAVNVPNRSAVDEAFRAATEAGAEAIGTPTDREWGGYSAYVSDPEGQRWEIAWLPGFLAS